MKKQEVRALIEKIGIVPVIRTASPQEARFAAEAVWQGGIPIVEITMTVPQALDVISELVKNMPKLLVGAGTVVNQDLALQCFDVGAQFLVTPGFSQKTVAAAHNLDMLIMAGALTPTEVMTAWDAGVDFVKIFPCSNLGGPSYIKALKGPLPHVPLVPTGGVDLETASDYIRAGAAALGVGGELVLKHAFQEGKPELISNLATRYAELVKEARTAMAAKSERTAEAH
ncbi:MAG TPA: bifunctional 4-hydroxy-2-oxoglutarate aldolase/2-dehydro-3-deoxy-phosphogluconate aldolase [Verrucomicrobiae bacterium]|jgi:2-dehydro-3-deoxyphosphogluconate aldolase/(4S)-4-hydroxy-2-oxoglutarate aldolase|nr:bifunctional 4-hydroxy-2-oxoglutarate aldolase/2-dehydro-3-deoxy-phosphogluconate aldolase [Verrucomicrobiae bacterium]